MLAQSSLIAALVLTAIAGIVLGMGMPTTPSYIVMVSLLVPAIIKLGAIAPAAHMFAFYFAILSAITPPVALAVFAAAGLAKSDLWATGWQAMRIAAATYIVPFMFIYEPSLMLIGDWFESLTSSASAVSASCAWPRASGLHAARSAVVGARRTGCCRAVVDQAGIYQRRDRARAAGAVVVASQKLAPGK